jgi:antitoxin CptB
MDESRLRWHCRRGMREIDELLTTYFDGCYADAPASEKSAFRRLIDLPDPELIGYLLDGNETADRELGHVISRIRSGTRAG